MPSSPVNSSANLRVRGGGMLGKSPPKPRYAGYSGKVSPSSQRFAFVAVFISACLLTWHTLGLSLRPDMNMDIRRHLPDVSNPFYKSPLSSADDELTLAFFLQISSSTMGHLPRLLRKLWEPVNIYAIHIDRKVSPVLVAKLKEELYAENPLYSANVFFMPPELITYRGVSMLLNTLNAMDYLLERSESWDYFINLSGSDYPLISPKFQRSLLKSSGNRRLNYIAFAPENKWQGNLESRYDHFYVDQALSFTPGVQTEMVHTPYKNPLARSKDFVYTNSEAWVILSREFCAYSTRSTAARKLLVTFAFSIESSEHYFSTLAYNSKYNSTLVPGSLRHIVWFHQGKLAGQHPFYVDISMDKDTGNYTFLDTAMGSPQFYLRKFKHANSRLMDYIDNNSNTSAKIYMAKNHFRWTVAKNKEWKLGQPKTSKLPFD